MTKITIYAIGKEKCSNMLSLQQEYIKRLPWKISIEEHASKMTDHNIERLKEDESRILISSSNKSDSIIVLDETGVHVSSDQFAELLKVDMDKGANTYGFLIGGAYGHASILKNCNHYHKISLSRMTFPHKMVRLIVLEQLYRAYTILQSHPYHK